MPERPVSDQYVTIDDTFASGYEDPVKGTYLNPISGV